MKILQSIWDEVTCSETVAYGKGKCNSLLIICMKFHLLSSGRNRGGEAFIHMLNILSTSLVKVPWL